VDLEIVIDGNGPLGSGRRRKPPKAEKEDNGRDHSGNVMKHSKKLLNQANGEQAAEFITQDKIGRR
jgi:hypothetical protein